MSGLVLALLTVLVLSGCGGGSGDDPPERPAARPLPQTIPPRPVADGPGLTEPAPQWVTDFCAEVFRRSVLRCPARVPGGFATVDLPQERPAREGYVLSGVAGGGWQVAGGVERRGPPLARARVVRLGRDALLLRWSRYAIRAPASGERVQRQMRAVARSLTRG